ncbi:MAG: GntR family transcriptional regulator [Burkholderiales bacterium]|jgi:DNA-binding GntR family transcriptional regulator|nr:GntR family transcriptional regulator [Burkholderiales bacterium]
MSVLPLRDANSLLEPRDPFVLAVEQTFARGHEWSRTAPPAAERIAIALAGAIVRDELPPGQRLPEKNISEALGVSRATTREALRILERECLVNVQARRGCAVAQLDQAEVMEIFTVRSALHGILFTQLMEEKRAQLEALIAKELAPLDEAVHGPGDVYVVRSYLLNLAIIDLCSNRLVADLLTSIALRTLRHLRHGHAAHPESIMRSLHSWRAIHRAVMLGDLDRVLAGVQARTNEARAVSLDAVRAPRQLAA